MEAVNSKYVFEDSMSDFANIGDHIFFGEKMISRYEWSPEVKERLVGELEHIKDKHNDKLLNLTVVGEFGTGKSTFINSILRSEDFLVSSALQGTTVAATVIEYSERYRIVLENHNGDSNEYFYGSSDALRDALTTFTTDPSVAKALRCVKIGIPAEQLLNGFRIIDTPGTNANETWHEEVTIRTIREMSDLVVLIVDANKPMSQSFCSFVKSHLHEMLGQCVFVTTRVDMVRKREREGVLDYIRSRIEDYFGIHDPMVLPYSSVNVFDSMYEDEVSELATISHESEAKILSFMSRQKSVAQTKKLISLMDSIYVEIMEKMNELSISYTEDLEQLTKSRQAPFAPFIETQKIEKVKKFRYLLEDVKFEFVNSLKQSADAAWKEILYEIFVRNSIDELREYTSSGLEVSCANKAQMIVDGYSTRLVSVREMFNNVMLEFMVEFEKFFTDIHLLRLDFLDRNACVPDNSFARISGNNNMGAYVSEQMSKESKAFFGGIVGFFGGILASSRIDEIKNSIVEKAKYPVCSYFSDIVNQVTAKFDDYAKWNEMQIVKELDRFLRRYNKAITVKLEAEEKRIRAMKKNIEEIELDMDSIKNRKFSLDSLNTQLGSLI